MIEITSREDLKQAIRVLETRHANEGKLLKEQLNATVESLKPSRLVKDILHDVTTSPELKGGIVNSSLGLIAGFLSKKILVGSSHNPIKQFIGKLLQMGVTNLVTKNAEGIKSAGSRLANGVFHKNGNGTSDLNNDTRT